MQRVIVPLIHIMDHPVPSHQVTVGFMDDPQINADNAAAGRFFVTTRLLHRANEDQLRAVLARELAHQDLKHVAKAQVLGVAPNIGAAPNLKLGDCSGPGGSPLRLGVLRTNPVTS